MRPPIRTVAIAVAVLVGTATLLLLSIIPRDAKLPEPAATTESADVVRAPSQPTAEHALAKVEQVVALADDASSRKLFESVNPSMVSEAAIQEFLRIEPVGRFRVVTVNSDAIRTLIRDEVRGISRSITFQLFSDRAFTAYTFRANEYLAGESAGRASWAGRVPGMDGSYVKLFVKYNGSVSGVFMTPLGTFELQPSPELPYHFLWEYPPDSERAVD